jgi:hypothetical protein
MASGGQMEALKRIFFTYVNLGKILKKISETTECEKFNFTQKIFDLVQNQVCQLYGPWM